MKIPQKIIDGSALLGVSLAVFALRGTNPMGDVNYWIMVITSFLFLIFSVIKVFERNVVAQATSV